LLIQKEPFLFKCILEIFSIYRKVCFSFRKSSFTTWFFLFDSHKLHYFV